jgi:hypothetical protein
MSSSDYSESEEFQRCLAAMYPRWHDFLKRSYPRLRDVHADLMQQTAAQLLMIARDPSYQVDDWTALGFAVLRRRLMDHFRDAARRWSNEPVSAEHLRADPSLDPERIAHYTLLLKRVVGLIAELPDADRRLLEANLSDSGSRGAAMSDVERSRLRRLRARLREQIDN